jgi:Arc/MetJ-type ribon-helix-helix transcriptional regulator
MKLSVSLSDKDVEFIDQYATEHGVESRSGVVQRAVWQLRATELGDDYTAAWDEWNSSDREVWDSAIADGVSDAAG